MKTKRKFISFSLLFIQIISINLVLSSDLSDDEVINLAVVACGDRAPETLNLLKSALMFTQSFLQFFIVAEPKLKHDFIQQFQSWPQYVRNRFNFSLIEPKFPNQNADEWRKLFKLCASQRIFLPSLLQTVDSVVYVDTDILFISDINDIWQYFKQFNETQLAALAPEHEEEYMGWYNRFARHPYYGKLGLNSGVMLMNLTRMREFKFIDKIYPIYTKYKYNITWGDQCLLNIFFHDYPDRLFVYGCEWNYRPDHCMYGSNCKTAEANGAQILHGCRRVFHNEKEPAFKAIYKMFDQYNFEESIRKNLLSDLKNAFEINEVADTYCGKSRDVFLKTIRASLIKHRDIMNNVIKTTYETNKSEL